MKSVKKAFGVAAGIALLVMGLSVPAQAAPIVMVSPASLTINISSPASAFFVDILVTGLTEPIGGYDFTLEWDATILQMNVFDPEPLDNFVDPDVPISISAPGSLSLSLAGDPQGSNDGNQDPLHIARLVFKPLAVGTTSLDLVFAALLNEDGTADIAGVTTQDALVCVADLGADGPREPVLNDPDCVDQVPEPAMLSLLAAGLATAVARRRASKRS